MHIRTHLKHHSRDLCWNNEEREPRGCLCDVEHANVFFNVFLIHKGMNMNTIYRSSWRRLADERNYMFRDEQKPWNKTMGRLLRLCIYDVKSFCEKVYHIYIVDWWCMCSECISLKVYTHTADERCAFSGAHRQSCVVEGGREQRGNTQRFQRSEFGYEVKCGSILWGYFFKCLGGYHESNKKGLSMRI